MKKRIASLFLAVLMAVSVISATSSAVAADDIGIVPYGLKCPDCLVGNIRNRRVSSVKQPNKDEETLSCGCRNYTEVYKEEWQRQCDNCTFVFPSETNYREVPRTDNSNCRGNH